MFLKLLIKPVPELRAVNVYVWFIKRFSLYVCK